VELEHLHVLEGDPAPPHDRGAVAGERVRVRRDAEHPAVAARGEDDRLRADHVELARPELVRDDPRGPPVVGSEEVQAVELVEESHVALHALLVQGLQDHVPGPIGRVAGSADGRLPVVPRVPAEPALVDPPVGRSVERQSPALELVDRVDRLFGHEERGRLVDEVVAALHRVERVPFGGVLLDVPERRADAALRRAGMRPGGVELRDHDRPAALRELDRGAQPGPAAADHDGVVRVGRGHPTGPHFVGSKVRTITLPITMSVNPST
jgi:hypothetical protein